MHVESAGNTENGSIGRKPPSDLVGYQIAEQEFGNFLPRRLFSGWWFARKQRHGGEFKAD
jgi:hypothetical protein